MESREGKTPFGLNPDQMTRLVSLGLAGDDSEEAPPRRLEGASDDPRQALHVQAGLGAGASHLGQWIGRYRLVSVLGEGGMGIVYLAQQEHPIRRQVALKVIKPGMDSQRIIRRFKVEEQTLALLHHPNIAQVLDAGTTEAGRSYFVMEYVRGLPITEYCDRNRLSLLDRLSLFQQVCHGVHHAHQKGIIHRDLKPSNILVYVEEEIPIPKIIDFGVAKAISQPLTEQTLFTEDRLLLGTPEYMSPEQAEMVDVDIDTRSDIYSLGMLLYVLLAGVLPFDPKAFRRGGLEHIRQTILRKEPRTPSTRLTRLGREVAEIATRRRTDVTTLVKRLRHELEWIPLKALRKDRDQRYRSASEMADDIENYFRHTPLMAGPPSTMYRLRKFVRRNRVPVAAAIVVLAVLVAGVVVSTALAVRAEREAKISTAVSEFLREDLLASVSPTRAQGREVTVRSFLDMASESLDAKFDDEPLVEASIRDTLGNTYRHLGAYERAKFHLKRACQLHMANLGSENRRTLKSAWGLIWVYLEQGRYVEAEALAVRGLAISRRVLGEEDKDTLHAMNTAAFAHFRMGCYGKSEVLYDRLLAIWHRELEEELGPALSAIGNLPWVYSKQGRYGEAEQLFNKALTLQRRAWGPEHPWTLVRMSNLAGVYRGQGRYADAERLYLKTLAIQRRVSGDEHVYTLWTMTGLARLYTDMGRHQEADRQFLKTLAIARRVLGEDHPDTLACQNGLAVLRTRQGRHEEAEPLLDQTLVGRTRRLGATHPDTLESKHNLAVLYVARNRYEQAAPLLLDAYRGRRTKLGPEHPHTVDSLTQLVSLYEAWDKPDEAEKYRAKLPKKGAVATVD